ncbi:hypothetical protein C7G42_22175, partial [Bradyrhizobium sp. MOS003]
MRTPLALPPSSNGKGARCVNHSSASFQTNKITQGTASRRSSQALGGGQIAAARTSARRGIIKSEAS